jgi:hypothetical protein
MTGPAARHSPETLKDAQLVDDGTFIESRTVLPFKTSTEPGRNSSSPIWYSLPAIAHSSTLPLFTTIFPEKTESVSSFSLEP